MRRFITALVASAMLLVAIVAPVAAGCDPGRASNGTNGTVTFRSGFPDYLAEGKVVIEEDPPFLEGSGEWEYQEFSLANGSNEMTIGITYHHGESPKIFTRGTGVATQYHAYATSLDNIQARIFTYQSGTTRFWEFWNGSTFLRSVGISSGKWTPNASLVVVKSSNQGNQIVGRASNFAYFRDARFQYVGGGSVSGFASGYWSETSFPGAYGWFTGTRTLATWDNC